MTESPATGMAETADVALLQNYVAGRWGVVGLRPIAPTSMTRLTVGSSHALHSRHSVTSMPPVQAAARSAPAWAETPPVVRARSMFRLKNLMEEHFEELAATVTREHGKTLAESRGSVRRGIECVEVACGAPSLMMGYALENIAADIDCHVVRQPLGVCAVIAPFNFPAMVPLWFLPFAVATGNTVVVKPSEQVPLTLRYVFELIAQSGLPDGVVNLVNGGRVVVEALLDHPDIQAVSFVGSTPVARAVYRRATATGKRVQALGGAKNFIVVMPDADLDRSLETITESFYGCAGERECERNLVGN